MERANGLNDRLAQVLIAALLVSAFPLEGVALIFSGRPEAFGSRRGPRGFDRGES